MEFTILLNSLCNKFVKPNLLLKYNICQKAVLLENDYLYINIKVQQFNIKWY